MKLIDLNKIFGNRLRPAEGDRDAKRALVRAGYMPLNEYVREYGNPLEDYEKKYGRIPRHRVIIEYTDGTRWVGPSETEGAARVRFNSLAWHYSHDELKVPASIRVEEVV